MRFRHTFTPLQVTSLSFPLLIRLFGFLRDRYENVYARARSFPLSFVIIFLSSVLYYSLERSRIHQRKRITILCAPLSVSSATTLPFTRFQWLRNSSRRETLSLFSLLLIAEKCSPLILRVYSPFLSPSFLSRAASSATAPGKPPSH